MARKKDSKSASDQLETSLRYLLDDLCVRSGFCIPPADADRIARSKSLDASTFADEVLRAEGFVPEYEKKWRRHIARQFTERFGASVSIDDC